MTKARRVTLVCCGLLQMALGGLLLAFYLTALRGSEHAHASMMAWEIVEAQSEDDEPVDSGSPAVHAAAGPIEQYLHSVNTSYIVFSIVMLTFGCIVLGIAVWPSRQMTRTDSGNRSQ